MIELISAALTPIIAISVTYIAYKQYKIDKDNLRLALYERRFNVYQSLKQVLAEASIGGNITTNTLWDFLAITEESEFFFGNEISEYLRNIHLKSIDLIKLKKKLEEISPPIDDERLRITTEHNELVKWFSNQDKIAKDLFLKYLSFKVISK